MTTFRRMVTERDLDVLAAVALSVGKDVWSDDGPSITTPDGEIVEIVLDIAQGEPHKLRHVHAMRRDLIDAYIIEHFWKGVGDAAIR